MRFVLRTGGRSSRSRTGDPDGVPVLYHHGTPGSGLLYPTWSADAAERGIRLIGYDRAGYGGSDRDPRSRRSPTSPRTRRRSPTRCGSIASRPGAPRAAARTRSRARRCSASASSPRRRRRRRARPTPPISTSWPEWARTTSRSSLRRSRARRRCDRCWRRWPNGMLGVTAEALVEQLRTILSPPDVAVVTGELGRVPDHLDRRRNRWRRRRLDRRRPRVRQAVGLRPGGDRGAGAGLAGRAGPDGARSPTASGSRATYRAPTARISAEDGHLTITELHLGEVHSWLDMRF